MQPNINIISNMFYFLTSFQLLSFSQVFCCPDPVHSTFTCKLWVGITPMETETWWWGGGAYYCEEGKNNDVCACVISIDSYRSIRVKDPERPTVKQVIVRKEDVSQRVEEPRGSSLFSVKQRMKVWKKCVKNTIC